ncbi:MAG TPA: M14 family zinc carboxypeptidase [Bacteroidales bacterium]|nr:M14 family zinc carboxypeptidase [Bacteroidales bacterium]
MSLLLVKRGVIIFIGILLTGVVLGQIQPFANGRGEVYFRFPIDTAALSQVNRIVSVDAVSKDSVWAYADQQGFTLFQALGIPHVVLPPPSIQTGPWPMSDDPGSKGILSWDYYPTYQGYEALMSGFAQQFPSLCRLHDLGTLSSGRKILALQITQYPDSVLPKPSVLYSSTMHGDEVVGYILMLRLADYLLSNYNTDTTVKRLVDNIDIWISPLANPNGTYAAGNNTIYGATRFNAAYVDLNRNYPDAQFGPHPDNKPWQPETIIYMALAQARKFSMGVNIHGGAEVCNYPWDVWSRLHPDNAWWVHVCRQYADTAQYYSPAGYLNDFNNGITNGYAWYMITGGRQDYMNFFHQCREFTLEISQQKLPAPSTLNNFWAWNYRSLLNYLGQALNGLHGTVKDSLTQQPVYAKVFAVGHDQDSSWVFTRMPLGYYSRYLPAGTYTLTYSAPGYHTKTVSGVVITNGQSTQRDVGLVRTGYHLSGHVVYNNANQTPMSLASVILSDSNGQVLDSTTADSTGYFVFNWLQAGDYQLRAQASHVWGGVNSADALAVMRHFVEMGPPITGLAFYAGDVNQSNFLNANDALLIQKRFAGLISNFSRPDWLSEVLDVNLDNHVQVIIKVHCTGDADSSYLPASP